MKSAVVVFPGSNCDRDVQVALRHVTGKEPVMAWHKDARLPDALDLIVVPGGFSYGDYLRCGAVAAHSPIMRDVVARANKGTRVLGICNGFQILVEAQLVPGVLLRNSHLKFTCRTVAMRVENTDSPFTQKYQKGQTVRFPVAHGEGNWFADADTVKRTEDRGQVAFRYVDDTHDAVTGRSGNPNGALSNIAGLFNEKKNVLGLMPHPERAADKLHGGTDGLALFRGLFEAASS